MDELFFKGVKDNKFTLFYFQKEILKREQKISKNGRGSNKSITRKNLS